MISDISLTDGVIRNSEWVLAPKGTETYKTLYTMKLKCYELVSKPVEAGGWNFQLQTSSKRSRFMAQKLWCLLEKCADKWSLRADKTLFYSPLSSETDLNIPFTRLNQLLLSADTSYVVAGCLLAGLRPQTRKDFEPKAISVSNTAFPAFWWLLKNTELKVKFLFSFIQ